MGYNDGSLRIDRIESIPNLEARLRRADEERRRRTWLRRWRWRAFVVFPLIGAVCWAALPWTFGTGVRALVSGMAYSTLLMSVAHQTDLGFMSYLGIGFMPVLIDALLFVGVVSWLIWASRAQETGSEPGDANHGVEQAGTFSWGERPAWRFGGRDRSRGSSEMGQ